MLRRRTQAGTGRAHRRDLLMQRIFGLALGYEDLNDHDELRHDPLLATLVGKREAHARRTARRWPARARSTGSSCTDRRRRPTATRRSACSTRAIERLFVDTLPRGARAAAGTDRARSRCHRRSAARPSGGPLLPRLLRRLLLSAAVRLLRRPSAAAPSSGARTSTRRPGALEEVERIVGPDPPSAGPGARSCCGATAGFCRETS